MCQDRECNKLTLIDSILRSGVARWWIVAIEIAWSCWRETGVSFLLFVLSNPEGRSQPTNAPRLQHDMSTQSPLTTSCPLALAMLSSPWDMSNPTLNRSFLTRPPSSLGSS